MSHSEIILSFGQQLLRNTATHGVFDRSLKQATALPESVGTFVSIYVTP